MLGVEVEQLLYGPEKGEKLRYRRVSFLSVITVIPVYLFLFLFILFSVFNVGADFFMFGDTALAMIIMYCYCTLKDEIRNRDYYNKTEDDEGPSEKPEL